MQSHNPVLSSIFEQKGAPRKLLKKDWSAEEKAWRANMDQFVALISSANPDCAHNFLKKKEDIAEVCVIINQDKAGESVIDPLAKTPSPAQPKDVPMTTDLDDIFDVPSVPPKTEEPKKEEPKAAAPKEDVFASADKESVASGFPPEKHKDPAPPKEEKEEPAEEKHKTKAPLTDLCEGFRASEFQEKVMSVVEAIMESTPDADLDQMADSIDDYVVRISVDAYRSDLDSISNHIAEVQAKRDAVVSCLIKLSAIYIAIEEALEFAVQIGVSCSVASNRERRVSEVHYMASDLFKRYTRIKHLNDQYERLYKHLGSQNEALSRLMTAQIERAKAVFMGNQRHGEYQNFVKEQEKPEVRQAPTASIDVQKAAENIQLPFEKEESKTVADFISAPVKAKDSQAVEGLSGLETFNAAPVKAKEKYKKGVVEW